MLKTFLNTLETMKGTMHFKTRTGSRLCYYCQLGSIFLIATASKNGRLLDISLGGVLYPTAEYEKLIIDGTPYVEDDVHFYKTLKGLTIKSIRRDVAPDRVSYFDIGNNDNLVFEVEDGRLFILYHDQDCCESVSLEDVVGDLNDLVGSPILEAECVSNIPEQGWVEDADAQTEYEDSFTWTYYKFATIKGHVNLRWYGSSNGYYSESVQELVVKPLEVKPDVLT